MSESLEQLLNALQPDEKRADLGWTAEVDQSHQAMASAGEDGPAVRTALLRWVQRHQPCVFGKLTAALDRLAVCVIGRADILQGDGFVFRKIQECRLTWLGQARDGLQSGFIVFCTDSALRDAAPDAKLAAFAQRVATLNTVQFVESVLGCVRRYREVVWLGLRAVCLRGFA